MKARRFWLRAVAGIGLLAAIGAVPNPPVFSKSAQSTVALITGIKTDPFYITMGQGAQAEADSIGLNLIIDGPSHPGDLVGQTALVDAMIARQVDAIMIAASDKQAMIPPLQRANDAGIKVISLDAS
jgi:ribose transport system substrate-binding protein